MNELIIIFLIFLTSYIILMRNFHFSVYVLIILSVLLHKELFSLYRWDLMPIRAFMLAVVCAGVSYSYKYFKKTKSLKQMLLVIKDPFLVLITSLWFIRLISIIFTKNLQQSVFLVGFFTTVLFLAFFLYQKLKHSPEGVLKYLKFYIYVVFALSLFGYFQLFLYQTTGVIIGALWNIPGNIARVGSTFWDVNHYGALLSALLPILGILILVEKGIRSKVINIIMFVSMLGALGLTNSRTAWIMAFTTFLIFVCILLVRKFGLKGIGFVIGALVLISIPFAREYSIKSSPFRAKIKQYFHYRMDSFDSHFLLLNGTFQIFEKYPYLGGGYGSFFEHFSKTEVAPTYFGRDPAAFNTRVPAHTIWGELVAETGVFGLLSFTLLSCLIIFTLLYAGLKLRDKKEFLISAAMAATFIGWLIAGIFYSYNSEFFWIILILFYTWGASLLFKKHSYTEIFSFFLLHKKALTFAIGIISFVLIFVSLGKNHLVPWDEAIYSQIAKNMVSQGEYIVQNWWPLRVWYEKPPLYMWMMSGFIKVLGQNSWTVRLPSALFGFATVMGVYAFGKRFFNKTAAFFSSLALVTTIHFLYYSRAAMLDVTATAFIAGSLFVYFVGKTDFLGKTKHKNALFLLSGIFIGLSVMTKGFVGLLPLPIIGLYELYLFFSRQQRFSGRILIQYALLIFSTIIVFLPWHLEMYRQFGLPFVQEYLGYHVWDRAVSAIEDKGRPFWWYFIVLRVSLRIWLIALLLSLPYLASKIYKKNNTIVFLSIWFGFMALFFSVAKSKLVWYLIPLYPAVALLVGHSIERFLNYIMSKYIKFNTLWFKVSFIFGLTTFSLFYLFLNRELVYTSDLTGSQSRLLEYKDEYYGVEPKVYVDRIEQPLVLYYTDGPFEIVDFRADREDRVPIVPYNEGLILLTKSGRYSEEVAFQDYKPKIILEDGDWILWHFDSIYESDKELLKKYNRELEELRVSSSDKYFEKLNQKQKLEEKINWNLSILGAFNKNPGSY